MILRKAGFHENRFEIEFFGIINPTEVKIFFLGDALAEAHSVIYDLNKCIN